MVEQWEIDLRKQLTDKKLKEQWEDQLQEEIEDVPPSKPKIQQKDNSVGFLIILIILSVIILGAFAYKSNWFPGNWFNTPAVVSPGPNLVPISPPSHRKELDTMRAELKELKDKVRWHTDQLTLVGVILNENFSIVYSNYDRSHLIFFNQDWTLNGMPRYISLTDVDRQFLQKYVK